MGFFDRLAGVIRKRSQMLSASVSLRSGRYFVVTIHGCDGSEPCISAGPVETLSVDTPHETLGNAILQSLKRTTHSYRYPSTKEQWVQVTAPLLSAAGCKSWNDFAKLASDLHVNQTAQQVHVLPCVRERSSFAPVLEREVRLNAPTAKALGEAVATELAFAAKRDGT